MKTDRRFLLGLLAFIILCSCARASQQSVSEKKAVLPSILEAKQVRAPIICLMGNRGLVGRGFFVAQDKVATNIHVMDSADPPSTYVRSKYATWSIQGVTAYDLKNDLVILKISGGGTPLPLGDSDTVQGGEPISVVEYSGAMEYTETEGTIHSIRNADKWLRIKINTPAGTSGSPVLNSKGQVLGVVATGYPFYTYAAPSNALSVLLVHSESTEPLAQWQKREEVSAHRYYTQANQKYGTAQYKEAIADLDKAIQLNPEFIRAYNGRAITKIMIGRAEAKLGNIEKAQHLYKTALEDLDETTKLNPKYSDAYRTRAGVKIELGKFEDDRGNAGKAQRLYEMAIQGCTQVIKLEPKEPLAYEDRGIAKYDFAEFKAKHGHTTEAQQLYEAAIRDHTQTIQLDPENAYAYNNRGWVKYVLGKFEAEKGNIEKSRNLYEGAITDSDTAVKLYPNRSELYHTRGAAKAAFGDFKGAIVDFDKAIEINPEDAEAYYERGQAKEALRQTEAAKADFQKAKALDPDVGQR